MDTENYPLEEILRAEWQKDRLGVAKLCQHYVNLSRNEEIHDPTVNGELALLVRYASTAKVVFDVGANTGEWIRIVNAINKTAECHCFEPCRTTFQVLREKGFPPNVKLVPKGVGARAERRDLHTSPLNLTNSLYKRDILLNDGTDLHKVSEAIEIVSLDAYCLENGVERIDLLKIDVEGHEIPVLHGARDLFARKAVGCCVFEYGQTFVDSRHLLKDAFVFAREVGYRMHKVMPDLLFPVHSYVPEWENFRYALWVLLPT